MRARALVSIVIVSLIILGCGGGVYNFNPSKSQKVSKPVEQTKPKPVTKPVEPPKPVIYYNWMTFDAVRANDIDKLKDLIASGLDVNIKDKDGNTPLHIAAMHNYDDVAVILIQNGADINAKDNYGETPLFTAIRFASPDVASLLISNKADIDTSNSSGEILSALIMKNAGDSVVVQGDVNKELAQNRIVINGSPSYSEFYRKNPYKKYKYVKNPLQTVQKLVNKSLNDFLTLKDNPVEIPPVVQAPSLPKPVSLKKSTFESTKSFRKRIEDAQKQRKQEIIALQNEYRKKVEIRNEKIRQAEQIAKQRKQSVELFKRVFMYDAMNHVFGKFVMADPEYDADKALMYVNIKATGADYSKKVALKVPEGDIARDFYENISRIPVEVVFSLNKDTVSIAEVKATRGLFIAKADLNARDFVKPEPMEVVVQNNVKFKEEYQKQNPNLVDTSNINIVVYEKTKEDFKDDLPALLASTKSLPVDNKKWLVAIGVENYDNTDKVIYSARSAKMFVNVAEKVLGVPKSHVLASIGDKATAGAIKANLKRLVENVKEGDTVYFYYSGHGIPVPEQDNEPYILPKDTVPDYIAEEKFFRLQNIYKMLSDSKAGSVIAFVDSCFSGVTDGESVYKGVAASRLKPKTVTFDTSKMVVLTAGTDKQFSNMYPDKGHRLFSYFLMKSMINGRSDVRTLYNEVYVNVKDTSFDLGGANRKQEPVMQGNPDLALR